MEWTRSELKNRAKVLLKENYGRSVLAGLIFSLLLSTGAATATNASSGQRENLRSVTEGISPGVWLIAVLAVLAVCAIAIVIDLVISFFLWNPMRVGCYRFFQNGRTEKQSVKSIFRMVLDCDNNLRVTMLLRSIYQCLWTLLLVVPGIVKHYEYAMIPYLLVDHPEMERKEIFAESKRMMQGQKWNAFVLDLSFIGWHILGACTFGILDLLYVAPYMYYTEAELYHTLKRR